MVSITSEQQKQILSVLEDAVTAAIEEIGLDVQFVIDHGAELRSAIINKTQIFLNKHSTDKEIPSHSPFSGTVVTQLFPVGAEGWMEIPDFEIAPPGTDYHSF